VGAVQTESWPSGKDGRRPDERFSHSAAVLLRRNVSTTPISEVFRCHLFFNLGKLYECLLELPDTALVLWCKSFLLEIHHKLFEQILLDQGMLFSKYACGTLAPAILNIPCSIIVLKI
jgi:hypothetical protein